MNSKPRRSLECLQLLNLIYIAFAIPMHISFDIKIKDLALMLESISLVVSFIVLILNFRTPVIVKGETTLSPSKVAKYYWQNGMLIDLCGIVPLNLFLGMNIKLETLSALPLLIVLFLRAIRIVSCWQALKIFGQFEVYLRNYQFVMSGLKAALILYFLGHWMTCAWHFVNIVIEGGVETTWATANELGQRTIGEKYLLCFYLVLNVATSVGYGDMYPVTDTERVFFCLMINAGDVLFALAFGLIAQITMQISQLDETQIFIDKMLKI